VARYPERDDDFRDELRALAGRHLDAPTIARLERWLAELRPAMETLVRPRFLHDDVHAGNIMCTSDGGLVALIDWGDAGWGDPALELAALPIAAIPHVVAGYEAAGGELGGDAEARILFDRLRAAIDDGGQGIAALHDFVRSAESRWRRLDPA
jgi:aminoglycoside phosphotransferase (APT) family kinase protein